MSRPLMPESMVQLPAVAPLHRLLLIEGDSHTDVQQAFAALEPHAIYSPFQQRGWLDSWQAHVGDFRNQSPVTIIGYRHGEPVLLLPLSVRRTAAASAFIWRAEDFCDYCGPLQHPSIAGEVDHATLNAILSSASRALGGVDMARLNKQPSRGTDFINRHHGDDAVPYHVSAHATRLTRDWQAYFRSKRSGKTLRKIKGRLNALESAGNLEIAFATTRAEATTLVIQCLDMKAEQLRKLGYWNPLTGRGAAAMLIACFGGGRVANTWVAAIKLDGKPLAIAYGFRNQKAWLVYQLAMAQGPHDHNSPGIHLLMFLLRHCCEQGVETFDLSLGDESYKTDWCDLRTDLVTDVIAFTPKGQARLGLFTLASKIRRAISTRPALYSAAKVMNRNLKVLSLRSR
jgi:CelD/BcsL family acetyltransferase involved in cellulose biosynthesis